MAEVGGFRDRSLRRQVWHLSSSFFELDTGLFFVYRFGTQEGDKPMVKTAMTHARLTPEVKRQAEHILKEMGISISAAQEIFYRQIIAHHGIPFDLRIPTEKTIQALEDARKGKGTKYDTVKDLFQDLGL
jgi:DNA-damage-inducible protein J